MYCPLLDASRGLMWGRLAACGRLLIGPAGDQPPGAAACKREVAGYQPAAGLQPAPNKTRQA